MKKFLLKAVIFLVLLVGMDAALGSVFSYFFYKVKSGTIFATTYAVKDCREEILFIGSSETSHQFISTMVTDSLGMSCYNLGEDKVNIVYQYATFRETIKRYTPKVIVLSSTVISDEEKEAVSSVKSLLPYTQKFEEVKDVVTDAYPMERMKLLSKSYPFNSLVIKIALGLVVDEPETRGYRPLWGTSPFLTLESNPPSLNPTVRSTKYFTDLLERARRAGCRVYIVHAPLYKVKTSQEDVRFFSEMSEQYGATFLNYVADTTFIHHPEYFSDEEHLNNDGARQLTAKIIHVLARDVKPVKQ